MAALADGGQELGGLVQQILETQKELEDVGKKQQRGPVEIVSFEEIRNETFSNNADLFSCTQERETGMTDLSQRREREATQREVDKLKESIQTLTRL